MSSSTFLDCDSALGNDQYAPVWTTHPVEFGRFYDSAESDHVAVAAWANQNRNQDSESELGYVSVGMVDWRTLPEPTSIGFRTGVAPAIACHKDFSSGYDCVVAFTDIGDGKHRVQTRRFAISRGLTEYSLSFDSARYVNGNSSLGRTSSRLALFWDTYSNRFVLVVRTHSSSSDQGLYGYYSTDGNSWYALVSGGLNGSVSHLGANAASNNDTWASGLNNQVVYAQ